MKRGNVLSNWLNWLNYKAFPSASSMAFRMFVTVCRYVVIACVYRYIETTTNTPWCSLCLFMVVQTTNTEFLVCVCVCVYPVLGVYRCVKRFANTISILCILVSVLPLCKELCSKICRRDLKTTVNMPAWSQPPANRCSHERILTLSFDDLIYRTATYLLTHILYLHTFVFEKCCIKIYSKRESM